MEFHSGDKSSVYTKHYSPKHIVCICEVNQSNHEKVIAPFKEYSSHIKPRLLFCDKVGVMVSV